MSLSASARERPVLNEYAIVPALGRLIWEIKADLLHIATHCYTFCVQMHNLVDL